MSASSTEKNVILDQHPVKEALEVLWVRPTTHSTEEKKLTVNKYLLVATSPFFHALFLGPFVEHKKNRFELVEPKLDALKAMLTLLDPYENGLPTRENVIDLLDLSTQYLVPAVHKKCQEFLLTLTKDDLLLKLKIADDFHLGELEEKCIAELSDLRSIALNMRGRKCGCGNCQVGYCIYCVVTDDSMVPPTKNVNSYYLYNFIAKSEANKGYYRALSDRMKAKLLDGILGDETIIKLGLS